MAARIILFVLVCISELAHQVNAQGLNSFMQNTAAVIGDTSTSLTCGAETGLPAYVTWSECITTPAPACVSIGYDDTLQPAGTGQYRLVATGNTGEFKLEIQSLATTEAGQYKCVAQAASTSLSYAEVIALAAAPSCTWNTTDDGNKTVEGDVLWMICQVNYTGRWAPVTRWNEELTASNETVPGLAKYSVIVEVGQVGLTYVATTSFDNATDTGAGEADNAPDYQHTHTYPALSVDFGPDNLTVTPASASYYVDLVLTCSASGNPAPSFKWLNINTTMEVSSGPNLTFTAGMLCNDTYQCVASNTDFRSVVHTATSDPTYLCENNDSYDVDGGCKANLGCLLPAVIVPIVVVAGVVVTVVVVKKPFKKKTNDNN